MMQREPAWRVFSAELNGSTLEIKGTDEKSPSHVISPLGAPINRVMISGVITEKENIGSDDEPLWKARIQDVSGNYFVSVGRYQPEAAAAMAGISVPSFVTLTGKIRTFTSDDGRVFVSIRPEKISVVSEEKRNRWILAAADSMWNRLNLMRDALSVQDVTADDLKAKGMAPAMADGIMSALEFYGFPESSKYLKTIQNALRMLLPDRNIDLGLPEDLSAVPDEIDLPEMSEDKEDLVLGMLDQLNTDGKGAPYSELLKAAGEQGISDIELEEMTNSLMDKGLVYEPMLGRLKRI